MGWHGTLSVKSHEACENFEFLSKNECLTPLVFLRWFQLQMALQKQQNIQENA